MHSTEPMQLALGSLLLATPVIAFGGIFGRREGPLVEITKSSTIVGYAHDEAEGDNPFREVTLQIQLEYELTNVVAETTTIGWIVPLPAAATRVQLGSALLFHSLDNQTRPTFDVEWLDAAVAGALSTDHFGRHSNLTYCTEEQLMAQCPTHISSNVSWFEHTGSPPAAPRYVPTDVAAHLDYLLLDTVGQVLYWLELNRFRLPHERENNTNENDWWLEAAKLQDLLEQQIKTGTVFLALQLQHHLSTATTTLRGSSQPIHVQYQIHKNALLHRLPLQMSTLMATPDATFQVFWTSPLEEERAVPINYLDLILDDAQLDWISCRSNVNHRDCLQKDWEERFHRAAHQLNAQSLVTEYTGPLDDVYSPLVIPEGLTVMLSVSTNWLGFLTNLKTQGIPPIPLVLQIIDKYVPPSNFQGLNRRRNNGDDQQLSWTVQACLQLNHLYEARTIRDDSNTPTLKECFDLYQPPTPDWVFDAQGLAAELDNQVFQPYRSFQAWVRSQRSLTRLYGRLDHANTDAYLAAVMNSDDGGDGGGDDDDAVSWSQPLQKAMVKAVAVCDPKRPVGIEFVAFGFGMEVMIATTAKTMTTTSTGGTRAWQPASYTASCEWEATGQLSWDVSSLEVGTTTATNRSTAISAQAYGGVELWPNEETGQFDPEAVDEAMRAAETLLRDVLAGKTKLEDVQEEQEEAENNNNEESNESDKDDGTHTESEQDSKDSSGLDPSEKPSAIDGVDTDPASMATGGGSVSCGLSLLVIGLAQIIL